MKVKAHIASNQEPVNVNLELQTYKIDLIHALNWYGLERERKHAYAYLREYVKTTRGTPIAKVFDDIPEKSISIIDGWLARLITNGNKLSEDHLTRLESHIDSLVSAEWQVVPEPVAEEETKKSVQENLQDKIKSYLNMLELSIDNYFAHNKTKDLYKELQAINASRQHSSEIIDWAQTRIEEFTKILNSNDPYVKESYHHLKRKQLTGVIAMLEQFIEDASKFSNFKKANRKPRARKVKSPVQQAAKVKYKKNDPELKINSAYPSEMVGAQQVWIYNTKYKKLTAYRTESVHGIQIKGTTLQNYDPEMTEQRSLRKPAETISKVLNAGKIQLRKIFTELTTKPQVANGRINEDCLIVRVVK